MNSTRLFSTALVASLLAAVPVLGRAAPGNSVPYGLASPPSDFEWGCFDPCACPILVQAPLSGTFVLRESHSDPLCTYYDVLDVNWRSPNSASALTITGTGTYRRGGEVAVQEQLTLELSFNGGPVQRFDSGLRSPGAPFPEIRTRISLHAEFCHDSVITVDAKPTATTGVGVGNKPLSLAVAPNPFAGSTSVGFALPEDGRIELAVYDLRGRRVRRLVSSEWRTRGLHAASWDGALDDRRPAPAGIYFVRLDSRGERAIQPIVKLR